MPFDDDDNDNKPKKGLKLNNNESSVRQKNSQSSFENKAKGVFDKEQEYNTRASTLSNNYKQILQDKTLPQNKTPLNKKFEDETVSGLIALAIEMNTDQNQVEGIGSIGLLNLLLKQIIFQKEVINNLEYRLHTIENKLK